jgi:hypothetical protein
MDLITSTTVLSLLFGSLGTFGLFWLLQWMRTKAYLRNAVVVITGATSGLGRGGLWGHAARHGESARHEEILPAWGP